MALRQRRRIPLPGHPGLLITIARVSRATAMRLPKPCPSRMAHRRQTTETRPQVRMLLRRRKATWCLEPPPDSPTGGQRPTHQRRPPTPHPRLILTIPGCRRMPRRLRSRRRSKGVWGPATCRQWPPTMGLRLWRAATCRPWPRTTELRQRADSGQRRSQRADSGQRRQRATGKLQLPAPRRLPTLRPTRAATARATHRATSLQWGTLEASRWQQRLHGRPAVARWMEA
mmetsp:Transcript_69658/g.151563  ORF Transcript_69658/g.151563 Transcript_69658/m.151563 type:complete len:229 (-) Transcript_69658:2611-3297(-)